MKRIPLPSVSFSSIVGVHERRPKSKKMRRRKGHLSIVRNEPVLAQQRAVASMTSHNIKLYAILTFETNIRHLFIYYSNLAFYGYRVVYS